MYVGIRIRHRLRRALTGLSSGDAALGGDGDVFKDGGVRPEAFKPTESGRVCLGGSGCGGYCTTVLVLWLFLFIFAVTGDRCLCDGDESGMFSRRGWERGGVCVFLCAYFQIVCWICGISLS